MVVAELDQAWGQDQGLCYTPELPEAFGDLESDDDK